MQVFGCITYTALPKLAVSISGLDALCEYPNIFHYRTRSTVGISLVCFVALPWADLHGNIPIFSANAKSVLGTQPGVFDNQVTCLLNVALAFKVE